MLEIAGIARKTEFSPNHELNDFLMIQKTAEELKNLGAKVKVYREEDIFNEEIKEDFIFSMVQSPDGSKKLLDIAKSKKFVINTPESVRNCYRYNMNRILEENKIPFPKSIIVNTDTNDFGFLDGFENKVWVKRGDAHAVQREDVIYLDDKSKVSYVLKEFYNRGLKTCTVQNHIEGDTIKFYSVYGKDLFYWYTTDIKYYSTFNEAKLKQIANESARVLGLEIFGGDAIVTNQSEIFIVDINDWPSFAPIRDRASKVIGNLIYEKALNNESR
jgi:glutathione synthase/RimK-type ligase-like ATP-grasp enzyme